MSDSETLSSPAAENASLNIHRGAIDQMTVTTTLAPKQIMERMGDLLKNMPGMDVTQKGAFQYRCLWHECGALKKEDSSAIVDSPTDDRADVVRFTVELTQLDGLKDTYSLDIRRLKGRLKLYKQIYDDIRELAHSCFDPPPESSVSKC